MLYLIIPPVVIIASLIFLLIILSRRAPEISRSEALKEKAKFSEGRLVKKERFFSISKISRSALYFLEKITQLFKVFLLRFYNLFSRWSNFAKEKRRKNGFEKKQEFTAEETIEEEIFVRKVGVIEENKESEPVLEILTKEEKKEVEEIKEEIERPMVSEEAAQPESYLASKSKFEEILIERIAADPRDLEAYERLGDYYMERKSYQDAKECFKQVLKLSPVNRRARIRMKKLERILGR